MEKKRGKFQNKRQKGNDGREVKQAEPDYELNEFKLGSPKFDVYYKVSLMPNCCRGNSHSWVKRNSPGSLRRCRRSSLSHSVSTRRRWLIRLSAQCFPTRSSCSSTTKPRKKIKTT